MKEAYSSSSNFARMHLSLLYSSIQFHGGLLENEKFIVVDENE
jgi:hypothetical protein